LESLRDSSRPSGRREHRRVRPAREPSIIPEASSTRCSNSQHYRLAGRFVVAENLLQRQPVNGVGGACLTFAHAARQNLSANLSPAVHVIVRFCASLRIRVKGENLHSARKQEYKEVRLFGRRQLCPRLIFAPPLTIQRAHQDWQKEHVRAVQFRNLTTKRSPFAARTID
jgi:hypothetical protein